MTLPVAVPGVAEGFVTVAVRSTDWPFWDGLLSDASVVVVVSWFTTCEGETADDTLLASRVSPPYEAVIFGYVPGGSNVVVRLAMPALNVPAPIDDPLLRNVTVPVALDGLTVAWNVTASPTFAGLSSEATDVVVPFCTTWVTVFDVLVVLKLSPL